MQTFLPYPDFYESAKCLDYRRLGKQRVEAMQIITILERHDKGEPITKIPWGNHPAVLMWVGYTTALKEYHDVIIKEWISRGYQNNMSLYNLPRGQTYILPPWFGRKDFHDAHKSMLLQKDYTFYSKYGWDVPLDLKYKWR